MNNKSRIQRIIQRYRGDANLAAEAITSEFLTIPRMELPEIPISEGEDWHTLDDGHQPDPTMNPDQLREIALENLALAEWIEDKTMIEQATPDRRERIAADILDRYPAFDQTLRDWMIDLAMDEGYGLPPTPGSGWHPNDHEN